ncbi:hypothetical protein ACLI4Z_04180 [Natrialbaceae archaeon A-arb3/5]
MTFIQINMISSETDRGQTHFDFLIGFSIFIMAVMFVFLSAPTLLAPFSDGQTENPLLADRIADDLSESTLVDPSSSTELNETAADEFFETSPPELQSRLGVDEHTRINVSLTNTSSGAVLTNATGTAYETGHSPLDTAGQMTVTQRLVAVDGNSYWLYVRVW